MLPNRQTGLNVLHLIYPIRWINGETKKFNEQFKNNEKLQLIFEENEGLFQNATYKQYFASFYEKPLALNSTTRDVIKTNQVIEYFHPSVQDMLFHQEDRPFHGYSLKHEPKLYTVSLSEDVIEFEWLASEIYSFDEELGFFVARISMKDYYITTDGNYINHPLSTYMKFVNRIRQNYAKYAGQASIQTINAQGDKENFYFIQEVRNELADLDDNLIISNVPVKDVEKEQQKKKQNSEQQQKQEKNNEQLKKNKNVNFLIEPNAFVHSFVKSNISQVEPLNESELYQLVHIDDYPGESGGTDSFRKPFVENNVYRRWENSQTYYTAIDYGTYTVVDGHVNPYSDGEFSEEQYEKDRVVYGEATKTYVQCLEKLKVNEKLEMNELDEVLTNLKQATALLEQTYHVLSDGVKNSAINEAGFQQAFGSINEAIRYLTNEQLVEEQIKIKREKALADTKALQKNYDFTDLFLQHHCRHYLLFILLQQHYRETLQEIQGAYARLKSIEDYESARRISNNFYKLNQTFYFQRITQEIQGREMWRFYSRIFELDELMKSAQADIQELNARSIEAINQKQSRDVMGLSKVTILTGILGMNVLIPLFSGDRESANRFMEEQGFLKYIPSWFGWWGASLIGFIITGLIICYLIKVYHSINPNNWLSKGYKKWFKRRSKE